MWRDLPQEQLADFMGISRSTVSLFERGSNVTVDVIKKYIITLKGIDLVKGDFNKRTSHNKHQPLV